MDRTPPEPPKAEPDRLQAEQDAAKRRRKRTQRIAVIAGTAALTTAVSGVVGGIVSPDRVQSVLGLSDDGSSSAGTDESPSASSSDPPTEAPSSDVPPALEFKRVQDSTGAIALDVPAEWATAQAAFSGIDGVDSPGAALRVGPDPTAVRFVSEETIWVAASSEAFDDLNLDDYDQYGVVAALSQRRDGASYLAEAGCVPTPLGQPDLGERWIGAARVWQDCSSLKGWRAVEMEMISAARDSYVFVQIGLSPDTPDEVSQRVVDSLTVLAANLPVS